MSLKTIGLPYKRSYPARVTEFTAPFWGALAKGVLTSTRCEDCGHVTFPPKPMCPNCWSSRIQWKNLQATGTLYSWTRVHAAPEVFAKESPYALGIVDLVERIRLACRLVPRDGVDFQPGIPVEIVVLEYSDGPMFAARPLAQGD
ncbi:Zn-ribbon domain-containing OB-fold protein [Bradyrhizobium canariense]|uniref:DNA-binding protein n=1 Tax=Bradyrhizobium canariense TaxID=255045 RepID=A0A1H1SGH9_9BRAD|nr:Zn-ribbon domain-containing OB-fold protein [Bradyrhizobium canariense]SDS47077.1 hypothetical protein SAMN05444158_2156 [Bradyrhizobium canariense]